MKYPLPDDTARILDSSAQKISNLGLALDKYLKVYEASDTDNKNKPVKSEDVWKHPPQVRLRKWASEHAQIKAGMQLIVKAASERHQAILASVDARQFIAAPDYRVVVGFGAEHVLETNLYLHRIYGFPIIPGSAVKGLARAFAFWEIATNPNVKVPALDFGELDTRKKDKLDSPLQLLDKLLSEGEDKKRRKWIESLQKDKACEEIEAIKTLDLNRWKTIAEDFYTIFGTQANRGSVTFFDAYPTTAPKLEPDILNPHFGEYYRQEKKAGQLTPPADYLRPVPNYFLTVAAKQEFRFAVAGHPADKAEAWLKGGLAMLGIGGKTSSGYGFMNEVVRQMPEQQAEASLLQQIQNIPKERVAGEVNQYVTRWRDLPEAAPQKKTIAAALIQKVRDAGREKASKDKAWYQELLACTGS